MKIGTTTFQDLQTCIFMCVVPLLAVSDISARQSLIYRLDFEYGEQKLEWKILMKSGESFVYKKWM